MSGWRVMLRDLYKAGGGPLQRIQFDFHWSGGLSDYALKRLNDFGLMVSEKRGDGWYWTITQLGNDLIEERLTMSKVPYVTTATARTKPTGNRRDTLAATWLSSLPRPGQVSLSRHCTLCGGDGHTAAACRWAKHNDKRALDGSAARV